MKRLCITTLIAFLLFWSYPAAAAPEISGESCILMDIKSGQILYEVEKDKKLPPASTTKMLTAILAIESGCLEEEVTIGANPPLLEGTRVYLEEGERVKLIDLVEAALIYSANDAALAIAEFISGSEQEFAGLMNKKAQEIGAVHSNFVNSHGLTAENHYTTSYDLALIGVNCMQNPIFREIVQKKTLDWKGQAWQTRLINKNRTLWRVDGADGIKTGYTREASYTIVASATRENQSYLAVILGSPGYLIWDETDSLLEYGFSNFQSVELAEAGKAVATVNLNKKIEIQLVPEQNFSVSLPRNKDLKVDSRVVLKPLRLSVSEGDFLGQIIFSINQREIERIDLLAGNSVPFFLGNFNGILYICTGFIFLQIMQKMISYYYRYR